MPSKRYSPRPAEGTEIPVSILGIDRREEMLWIAAESGAIGQDAFPPCIQNIFRKAEKKAGGEKGKHRKAAILAAFLGQLGFSEARAKQLWLGVSDVEDRIFSEWFQRMHCPKCETLKKESKGYPDLGTADLGLCQPDELCNEFDGPVEYACGIKSEEDRDMGSQRQIKILYLARIFDWTCGREGEIELSKAERNELEALLAELAGQKDKRLIYTRVKMRGRLRPKFNLRDSEGPRRQMLSDLL